MCDCQKQKSHHGCDCGCGGNPCGWKSVNEGKSHREAHCHKPRVGKPAAQLGKQLGFNYARRSGQTWFPKRLNFGAYGDTTY